jgi:hypothetical protein
MMAVGVADRLLLHSNCNLTSSSGESAMVRYNTRRWWQPGVVLGSCSLVWLTGCGDTAPAPAPPAKTTQVAADDHDKHDHDHDHDAPHGGALVVVGDEAGHVELVLDPETGKLTAYVLDAHAEDAVPVAHAELKLAVTLEKEGVDLPEAKEILLLAVNPADGKAAEFAAVVEELKGAKEFDVALEVIRIGDKEHKGIAFRFPEGKDAHNH